MPEIETICPICRKPVLRKSEAALSGQMKSVECENEYYIHFIDPFNRDILNRLEEPTVGTERFK